MRRQCVEAPILTVVAERNGGRDGASDARKAAQERHASVEEVALGSHEGELQADDALRRGASSGSWVLLENAHLASKAFIASLEKKIREVGHDAAPGFRVILTIEVTADQEALPRRLFSASRVIALPSDAGLRASLLRHDALVEANEKPPRERGRVRALFALAHAVVTERARYDDGWSKPYEWGDVDAVCAYVLAMLFLIHYHRSHTWRPRTCPGCRCGTPSRRRTVQDSNGSRIDAH